MHELALHHALRANGGRLFRPGPGRSAFLIEEPEIGFGRPDAIIVIVSASALQAFRKLDLRLPSLTAARSLEADSTIGVSVGHSRSLVKGLVRDGWNEKALIAAGRLLFDSVSVEAKMSDWKRAIRQATGYRLGTQQSAVLMPQSQVKNIQPVNLDYHGIGLLQESAGRVEWVTRPKRSNLDMPGRAWLVELLIRGLADGSAYKLSERRKIVMASESDCTRAL